MSEPLKRASYSGVAECDLPQVSVIVAARNEERFIGECLESIIESDYPHDRLEVLVIDGMSSDGTRSRVSEYSTRFGFIRLLDNPAKITPAAFNVGIRHASGDLIMIMSAHAMYAPDAIRKCVQYSFEYGAENVGGICITTPRDPGIMPRCIVRALSHPFGVGGSAFRTGGFSTPRWSDTAAFGCYRREVFENVGMYNENLIYSQDMEFNMRLKKAGGRTLLAPDIVLQYSARTGLRSFCLHNFRNGKWAVLPFAYSDVMPVGWRHLVPFAFIVFLLVTGISSLFFHTVLWLFGASLGAYILADIVFAIDAARKERDWRQLFLMPFVFPLLHFPYGFGSLVGLTRVALSPHRLKLRLLFSKS